MIFCSVREGGKGEGERSINEPYTPTLQRITYSQFGVIVLGSPQKGALGEDAVSIVLHCLKVPQSLSILHIIEHQIQDLPCVLIPDLSGYLLLILNPLMPPIRVYVCEGVGLGLRLFVVAVPVQNVQGYCNSENGVSISTVKWCNDIIY